MKSIKLPALIALILVPLLAVAALIGLTVRDDEAINAAVVNLDEAVTIDGQMVPMGRQLAAEMVDRDGSNVTWTLADAPSAAAGLKTGEYSAVVTIPKNFSAAATSFSANDAAKAEQATIDVEVSDNAPVTDSQLAQQVARLATDSLNSTLTSTYLDGIYVGFNTVGDQFSTITEAVDQLHDGSKQLSDGTEAASQGANQLASGLGQLRDNSGALIDGGNQLASGGSELVAGGSQLNSGASELSSGASQLADGVGELADQAPQLVDGVGQLADGADQLLTQIPAYADGAAQAIGGVGALSDGLTQAIDGLGLVDTSQVGQMVTQTQTLAQKLSDGNDELLKLQKDPSEAISDITAGIAARMGCTDPGATTDPCKSIIATISAGVEQGFVQGLGAGMAPLNTADPTTGMTAIVGINALSDGVGELAGGLGQFDTLQDGLTQIRDGADQITEQAQPIVDNAPTIGDGATQLLTGINQLNAQIGALPDGIDQLSTGTSQLADGASQLADGVSTYTDGVGTFASGVTTYTQGVAQYADGVTQAADGADEFAAGMVDLDKGVGELEGGIGTFAKGLAEGADQVPSYSQSDRETLSSVVSDPVEKADSLIESSQVPMISLLLACALWLGALASFIAVRPIPRDVVTSRASSLLLWARTLWLPLAIVAGQGILMGIAGGVVLDMSLGTTAGLAALMAVAGVSFVFANHALAAWLGNVGRAISALLLVVTIALGLSSATGWLNPIGAISPLHNAFRLMRTWLAGGSGEVGLATVALLMGAIGAVLSIMSITARRRLTPEQYRKAA